MLKLITAGLVWSGILLSFCCFGQELPLGALPMQYNGSFAGETSSPRISSNFGFQTSNFSGFRSRGYNLNTSYDQFIPAIRSGIGISAGSFNYSSRATNFTNYYGSGQVGHNLSIAIAPKFSIKGKYTLSPSLDFHYGSANHANHSTQQYYLPGKLNININSYGSKAGLLFNTSKYYIGYSVSILDHLNAKSDSSTYNYSGQGRYGKFTSYLQLGYTFQKSSESKFSFTPQFTFLIGGKRYFYLNNNIFGIEAYNINFRYKQFIWGLNNAGLHLGWQTDKLRLMLSSDTRFSGDYRPYTANLSFRYVFKK